MYLYHFHAVTITADTCLEEVIGWADDRLQNWRGTGAEAKG